ncbi:hypothetical protein VPH35_109788 [Triticum aestivum]|uniref:Uncharacterized protein n=1 Tax=Triticum turgidum subsp. durum TaxID=4567 RepID=A0A9R1B8D8_TRITD|nr:unnamed protein product [Triticum turgidum subsp. durum]
MSRRFLYMVLQDGRVPGARSYTLHRIGPSLLFYPKDSPERAAAAAASGATATTMEAAAAAAAAARARERAMWREPEIAGEKALLERPVMTFPSPYVYMDFALTGRRKDQIVASERRDFQYRFEVRTPGRAVLYDDASQSVRDLTSPEREDVPLAAGEDETPVRGLIREPACRHDWHWYTYPPSPPPYQSGDAYGAYAAPVDGWHIWASARGHGTYSMHTVTGEWSKLTDRALPFQGRAACAPEHGLWFSFPAVDSSLLAAWDLHASGGGAAAAPARGVWESFRVPRRSWNLKSHLVHLGDGGRFCVARLFRNDISWSERFKLAVLTGVEVERCDGGELLMIKHRSFKYRFDDEKYPHLVL